MKFAVVFRQAEIIQQSEKFFAVIGLQESAEREERIYGTASTGSAH